MNPAPAPILALGKRVVTSTLLIGLTAGVLFYGSPLLLSLEAIVFTAFALFEFFTLLRQAQFPCYRFFGVAVGSLIPLIVLLESGSTQSGEVLFLVLSCVFLFILQFSHTDNTQALVSIALTLFGMLYISWFLSFVIKIRFMQGGVMWLAYLLAVTKAADIGAYTAGTLFGKHTLIPHVSPKKSVEGLFGGLLLSVVVSELFKPLLPLDFIHTHLWLLGLFIGGIGQVGDLSESLMKRFCNAKDSGAIFPGMGGVLDAIDSIIFTAPIFYFHLKTYL